jgi:hypothetical protein
MSPPYIFGRYCPENDQGRLLVEAREKYRRDQEARQEYAYLEGERKGERKKAVAD